MGPLLGAIAGPAVGAAISGLGSFFSGKQAADQAKENYKKRYQWQVQDLKKAGLNPMLAVSQGAPNVPQAPVPDIGDSIVKGANVGSAVSAQAKLLQSQKENVEADTVLKGSQTAANVANTRATTVQTGLVEPKLVYSSVMAEREVEKITQEIQKLGFEASKIQADTDMSVQALSQSKAMQPLVLEAQRLLNKASELGLSEKEAESKMWETLEKEGKMAPLVMQALKLLLMARR